MRKFILIAAIIMASASAQAGAAPASSDAPTNVEQSKATEAPTSIGRQRPALRYQSGQRLHRPGAFAIKTGALKRRGAGVLARIKYALHRRGIHWR
jgi:hypothetical protein